MKIRIIKESKKRLKKIDESIKDYTVAAGLSLGGMFGAGNAQAGVEGYSSDTVELATAFAKEGLKNSNDVDKNIIYSKALEDLKIANKTPEMEKKKKLNKEAQDLLNVIDNFLKNADEKDLEWAKNLVKKSKESEIQIK